MTTSEPHILPSQHGYLSIPSFHMFMFVPPSAPTVLNPRPLDQQATWHIHGPTRSLLSSQLESKPKWNLKPPDNMSTSYVFRWEFRKARKQYFFCMWLNVSWGWWDLGIERFCRARDWPGERTKQRDFSHDGHAIWLRHVITHWSIPSDKYKARNWGRGQSWRFPLSITMTSG
jgi:hypothetical protein